jgi:hypothetical protein
MSTPHLIQTIIEIFFIILVLIALFNEYKIVEYEKKIFKKIKKFLEVIL